MAELKYNPVAHDQKAFLDKVSKRRGFREAYDALEAEHALAHEMLSARTRAGLTQEICGCSRLYAQNRIYTAASEKTCSQPTQRSFGKNCAQRNINAKW